MGRGDDYWETIESSHRVKNLQKKFSTEFSDRKLVDEHLCDLMSQLMGRIQKTYQKALPVVVFSTEEHKQQLSA